MSNTTNLPALNRQETATSYADSTAYDKGEKGEISHRERADAIAEEDEGPEVGVAEYEKSKQMESITPAENKRILRKIDWLILPLFLITQTLQYLDKTALNYAKVFGMEKSMGLHGNQYNIAAAMFYVGYLVAQMPFAYLIGRYPAGKVLGASCVVWGISVFTMVANKSYTHILVNRFFLGVTESAVTPGLSLMTGFWWRRDEAPLRQTIWYSAVGIGGMIGSLMAAGISQLSDDGPVPRWQMIFYILGAITTAFGFILYFFLADGPSNARWLSARDRTLAVARVASNGTGIKSSKFDVKQAIAALKDPKAWLLTLAMFGSSIPNGILTNFSGPIITAMGFSTLNAALLDCAGRSLQCISLIIAGLIATKFKDCRIISVTIGNSICVLGSGLMSFLPFEQTWIRLVGFWLINCQSIGFTLGLVMISSNIGGYTKRSVTSTMVFIGYCVGNILGPLFVYPEEKPVYRSAAYAMLGSYLGKLICHGLLGLYMWRSNINRDKKNGPANVELAADRGMRGVTEDDNPDFRYVL